MFDLYNAYGKRVMSFESASEPHLSADKKYEGEDDEVFVLLSYDKGLAIFDGNKLEEIYKTEENVNARYSIYRAFDKDHIFMTEYTDDYKSRDERTSLYYVNKTLLNTESICGSKDVDVSSYMVTCDKDDYEYPITDEGKLRDYPTSRKDGKRASYADVNHYFVLNSDSDELAVYSGNDVVKTYSDVYDETILRDEDENIYFFIRTGSTNKERKSFLIKDDGTEVFTNNFGYSVRAISKDGTILAYDYGCSYNCPDDEKREEGYYIYDKDGKKIYDRTYRISHLGQNYFLAQSGSPYYDDNVKYTLLDSQGKELKSGTEYSEYAVEKHGLIFARKLEEGNRYTYKYVFLDKDLKPVIEFGSSDVDMKDEYFRIKDGEKYRYFNMSGKEFYSE